AATSAPSARSRPPSWRNARYGAPAGAPSDASIGPLHEAPLCAGSRLGGEAAVETQQQPGVELADARLGEAEAPPDLAHREAVAVAQADQVALRLGEREGDAPEQVVAER